MPYQWLPSEGGIERLQLWPYRALGRRGFVWFIAITASCISLPLIAFIGSPVLWMLLPFLLATLAAIWFALRKNERDREIYEELRLSRDQISLTHIDAKGHTHRWDANPYWVRPQIYPTGRPVPHYLTLKGHGREVEIGAFLSEDERRALHDSLCDRLRRLA